MKISNQINVQHLYSLMTTTKTFIKHLTLIDIAILSLIFFGIAIISSNYAYFMAFVGNHTTADVQHGLAVQSFGNLWAIGYEVVLLAVAFAYLKYRRFDFGVLNFAINRRTIPKIGLYFMVAGTIATLVYYAGYWIDWAYWQSNLTWQNATGQNSMPSDISLTNHADTSYAPSQAYQSLSYVTPSLIAFALLNGFFEELFFIGLLFATPKYTWRFLLPLSVVLRFSFHTYQGLWAALSIATLGLTFIYFRKKDDELLPFMLTHSIFDVLGLGLPLFLFDDWY